MTILITGGTGLVGTALQYEIDLDKHDTVFLSSKDCNLTDFQSTYRIFNAIQPDIVIHLAANVGGLFKNMNFKSDMLNDNLIMNYNVLKCCHDLKVKKVVSCLSTCIFPDKTTYPINEDMLHDGAPHSSNDAYAYSKRMLDIQSKAYREQFNDNFICIIPTNIYGKYDNYSLTDGHVIPALIHRCYKAKQENKPFVVKGTGKPLRQFIYANDLAKLIVMIVEDYHEKDSIILSVSEKDEVSIRTVAEFIAKEFDYMEHIVFDDQYSDGQYKKTADNNKLMNFIKNKEFTFTPMKVGIKESVQWFTQNYILARK
jgi:GDP-L-fucose synthase